MIHLDTLSTLVAATLVLLLGRKLVHSVSLLKKYTIPEPVAGGLLVALALLVLKKSMGWEINFDMSLKDPLMLAFFATIGLNANLASLRAGGKVLGVFLIVVVGLLLMQNAIGIGMATLLGLDPLMGLLVARTRTRHGQFRPFLLWGAIPFGIVCVLTFYTPDFSAQGKIIYACVTYILLTLVYTFVNVPYCAMPGVITADPKERHALQSWRFFLAAAGSLAISGIALPLVSIIGKGDEQVGYFGAMCVLGLTGVVLLYVCFFTTKERYTFEVQPGSSVAKDLKLLLGNGQWRIMCAFKMMATCSNVVRGGATLYFVKYVMDHPEMATQFLLYGSLATMFGSLCSSRLLGRFDRVTAFKWIIVAYSLISLLIFVTPAEHIALIFALNILFLFVFNTTTPLQWLMASDVVDYEESRSGRRLDGLVFSTYLFSLKIGLAIGGAVVGWILAYVNYSASSSVQPVEVLTTIKILFCVVPVVLYAGMFIMLSFYKLTDARVEAISQQLIKHRAAQGEAVPDAATAASH